MNLNDDFSQRAVVHGGEIDWTPSPMAGVDRRMLDRIGDEVARATSIVRYAPGSRFSPHTHGGGEEFLVLEGVFQDEHGDYPAGTYVRNPPTSRHTPGSAPGCVIFVKLWQFDPHDRTFVRTDIEKIGALSPVDRDGVRVTPLYEDDRETVRIEHWAPGASIRIDGSRGAEVFLLAGAAEAGDDPLKPWSWLRAPIGPDLSISAGPDGARAWVKTGRLEHVTSPSAV